jgi:uncharacterized membrane protein
VVTTIAPDQARHPAPGRSAGRLTAFGLSLLGTGLAGYLTYEHYTGNRSLACSDKGAINCAKVTTSAQSMLLGLPVALWGLAFFAGMIVLTQPIAWRWPALHRVRLVAAFAGIAFVAWLVRTELVTLHAICLWCTGVHLVTLALLITLVLIDPTHPSEVVQERAPNPAE